DDVAIRKTLEAYADAYNKGDLATVLAFWADNAEFIDESGTVTRGKDAIAALFKQGQAGQKGKALRIKVTSLRLPRPDLALLDGTAETTTPDGGSDSSAFAAVWTKTDGRWLVVSVRDLPGDTGATENPNAAQLRQLDWLVGEWTHQDKETAITLS